MARKRRMIGPYIPLLAVLATQALVVALVPSSSERSPLSAGSSFDPGADVSFDGSGPTSAETVDGLEPGAGGAATGGSSGPTRSATGPGGTGPTVTQVGGYDPLKGDTSHCVRDEAGVMRQWAIDEKRPGIRPLYGPMCIAKWPKGSPNGGATYRGVTGDKIHLILFRRYQSPEEQEALKQIGLAGTTADYHEMFKASIEFATKAYELYGRTISYEIVEHRCEPNDIPCIVEEARKLIPKNPFLIGALQTQLPAVFDVWAKAGIISVGGQSFARDFFNKRAPYRFSTYPDLERSLEAAAEYYCKKLAGKSATNTGSVIHGSIGGRGSVQRRYGLIVNDSDALLDAAQQYRATIERCANQKVPFFTISQDFVRAQDQAQAITTSLIQEKVTSVSCICWAAAPIATTRAFTAQGYFPEHVSTAAFAQDHDAVGRLYDQEQWQHFFGPTWLPPFNHNGDYSNFAHNRVWRASGRQGNGCEFCFEPWNLVSEVAELAHHNGSPNLSPQSVYENVILKKRINYGGWNLYEDPDVMRETYGPGDFTLVDDFREGYWVPTATSPNDGRAGAFVSMNGGKRYDPGQWDSSFTVPPAPK